MNKFVMMGLALTTASGFVNTAQASSSKCVAEYVGSVLQNGKMDKGDFVILEEVSGSERRYGMEVNGGEVPDHMAVPMQAVLNGANTVDIETQWVPSKDRAQEKCGVQISHANGSTTEVTLYPYANEKNS